MTENKFTFWTIFKVLLWDLDKNEPSSRKIYAFLFCTLSVINVTWLIFSPDSHFITKMSKAKVDAAVIISVMGFISSLAFGALAVYGWKDKEKK